MEETEKIIQRLPNQEFDYFKIGKILLSRWYWIAACVITCYIGACVYLWYTPKTYATQATMKLEEKKSEITDLLGAINSSDKSQSTVQSETFILQSRSLILNAVKDLDYPISFYIEGRVRVSPKDLYPQRSIDIKIVSLDSQNYYRDFIALKPINANSFNLTYKVNGVDVKKNFLYNNPINIGSTIFIISNTNGANKGPVYLFRFNNLDDLVNRVRGGLSINEVTKNSNIISLREADANPQFAADALNALMNEYQLYNRTQKQQSASQIISFIDAQLDTISAKVKESETAIEDYKKNSKLMDVSSAAQIQIGKATDLEAQRNILKIQQKSIDDFKQQVVKSKENVNL